MLLDPSLQLREGVRLRRYSPVHATVPCHLGIHLPTAQQPRIRKIGGEGPRAATQALWGGCEPQEAFQGVLGGRDYYYYYILTKFGLKLRYLDVFHSRFHDYSIVFLCSSPIDLFNRHTGCVAAP